MSKKGKLEKFKDIESLANVYRNQKVHSSILLHPIHQEIDMRGKWNEHFCNDNPIHLELACGRGEYTVGLAQMYPNQNFIGMDLKGNRIWTGAKFAMQKQLQNAAFLRSQIDFITNYFAPGEIQDIWITFADPQIEKPRKRLSSPLFLERYRKLMNPNGSIHLKTDSKELHDYTLEQIHTLGLKLEVAYADIYALDQQMPEWEIKTYYEKMHMDKGKKITYLRFKFNA